MPNTAIGSTKPIIGPGRSPYWVEITILVTRDHIHHSVAGSLDSESVREYLSDTFHLEIFADSNHCSYPHTIVPVFYTRPRLVWNSSAAMYFSDSQCAVHV